MIRLADVPAGHPARKVLTGRIPYFAAPTDPRCSYTGYVPPDYEWSEQARVVVSMHGLRRDAALAARCSRTSRTSTG